MKLIKFLVVVFIGAMVVTFIDDIIGVKVVMRALPFTVVLTHVVMYILFGAAAAMWYPF